MNDKQLRTSREGDAKWLCVRARTANYHLFVPVFVFNCENEKSENRLDL